MGHRPMTVLLFVFTAVLLPVLLGEAVDWTPWVATQLIRRAAAHLPPEYRARYEEEWAGEFCVLSGGKLAKLLFGVRVYTGARRTGAELQKQLDRDTAERDVLEPLRTSISPRVKGHTVLHIML